MGSTAPRRTVRLSFGAPEGAAQVPHLDLSCLAFDRGTLFVSGDESAGVERLLSDGDGFGRHRHVALGDLLDLPDGPDGEMDVEGMSLDDGWLWVLGSQSYRRRKPKEGEDGADGLARMAEVEWQPNRQFLGRLPLVEEGGGLLPVAADGERRAAHLAFGGEGRLRRWLRKDPHLAPFLRLPAKENGLDVEGIATRGGRVWLGLRGPVLGRCAVVLELRLRDGGDGRLKAERIEGRSRVRKHVFDTGGLGVRDLKLDGDDLLVVVGTVMSGDGPAAVLRLPRFALRESGGYLGPEAVRMARRLPERGHLDHPEGLAHLGGGEWLVVYDSPRPARLGTRGGAPWVDADVWTLR